MQFLQSVESPISHKLDCLQKCDQNFFKVQGEVLVISLSVKVHFLLNKDCLKMCEPRYNFQVTKGRRFWWKCNFYQELEVPFPTNQTASKSVIGKKIQVPCRRKFWCQCNLYRVKKSYFPQVLVAMQVYQVLEVVFHLKKDCLKMCEPQHNFKVTKGRRFW